MSAEFEGRSWGVGVVRGVRSFDVDASGRLLGVSYKKVWNPGENVAVCGWERPADGWAHAYSMASYALSRNYYTNGHGVTVPNPPMVPAKPEPHSLAGCSHGFYAYYDGSNDYKSDARISAVVEGYGETLIGTRGFRAEKAKIVALCIPSMTDEPVKVVKPKRLAKTSDRIVASLWAVFATYFAMCAVIRIGIGGWVLAVIWALVSLTLIVGIAFIARRPKAMPVGSRPVRFESAIDPDVIERVRRNYPDVTIYSSFAEMVAAVPPDKGLEPSPETDPDFWTRT